MIGHLHSHIANILFNELCSDSVRFFISDQQCMLYFDRFQADTNSKFSDCSYIIGHLNSIWTYILLLQVSRHTVSPCL